MIPVVLLLGPPWKGLVETVPGLFLGTGLPFPKRRSETRETQNSPQLVHH